MDNLFNFEEEPIMDNTPQPEVNDMVEEPADDYQFATGDLGNFMHDFEEEKENMGIDQRPTAEEMNEIGNPTIPTKTARKTGKFVTTMLDITLATGLSIVSGEPKEKHQADTESKKELEDVVTEYIKETGGEIPLSVQLFICIFSIYGLQIPEAIRLRKEKQEKNNG